MESIINNIPHTTTTITNQNNPQPTQLYSNTLKNQKFPSKENAIIMERQENIDFHEYILALESITNLQNIIDAYPTSHNRILVYFKSKEIADSLTEKYSYLYVKNFPITIRKMINPATRMVITCPAYIPHQIIFNYLQNNLNIKLVSPITHIKLSEPRLSHINSGRRQTYIASDQDLKTEDSFLIQFEDEQCRIYYTTEKCSVCGRYGHNQEKCRSVRNLLEISPSHEIIPTPNPSQNIIIEETQTFTQQTLTNVEIEETQTPITQPILGTKRLACSSTSTNEALSDEGLEIQNFAVPQNLPSEENIRRPSKLLKKETDNEISETLIPLKKYFEINKNPPLNFEEFKKYINLAKDSPDPLNIARSFKTNIEDITNMLNTTKHYLKDSKTKAKFTRLVTRINKQLGIETAELSQESSS